MAANRPHPCLRVLRRAREKRSNCATLTQGGPATNVQVNLIITVNSVPRTVGVYTDTNGNGKYDKGECFEDVNGNGVWDSDMGEGGQGGADDAVLYTMTVSYNRLFPMAKMLGWSATQTITASTVLRNQPYGTQSTSTPQTICT